MIAALAVLVTVDVKAFSKGRPSGIFARMPAWLVRAFTWRRTQIGHIASAKKFPVSLSKVEFFDGELVIELDKESAGGRRIMGPGVCLRPRGIRYRRGYSD